MKRRFEYDSLWPRQSAFAATNEDTQKKAARRGRPRRFHSEGCSWESDALTCDRTSRARLDLQQDCTDSSISAAPIPSHAVQIQGR